MYKQSDMLYTIGFNMKCVYAPIRVKFVEYIDVDNDPYGYRSEGYDCVILDQGLRVLANTKDLFRTRKEVVFQLTHSVA